MRKILVTVILLSLFVMFGASLALRGRSEDGQKKAIAAIQPKATPAEKTKTKGAEKGAAKTDKKDGKADAKTTPKTKPVEVLKRPLRIVSRSWELIAPGVVANDGIAPTPKGSIYEKEGLKVEMKVVDTMKGVESALARGGDDEKGADIALVSLPAFVASYERLRALKPQVFFVVARSYGREGILSDKSSKSDLFAGGLAKRRDLTVRGFPGEPATFMTLYALDLSGYPLEQVSIELPKDEKKTNDTDYWLKGRSHRFVTGRSTAKIGAFNRGLDVLNKTKKLNQLVFSTADAQGLIPYVAVASKGFLDKHAVDLSLWSSGWIKGVSKLQADVPGGGRLLAKQSGAPEILKVLDLLGWVEFTSPRDNARMVGLSGRGAMDLKSLLAINWRVWKAAGVLTTPQPESRLIRDDIVAEVIRNVPGATKAESAILKTKKSRDAKERPVLVVHTIKGDFDPDVIISKVGQLSGIFTRSKIVLQLNEKYNVVPGQKKSKKRRKKKKADTPEPPKPLEVLTNRIKTNYNLADARIESSTIKGTKAVAVIRVLASQ